MSDRWVCKRCFADNNDTNAACQRCGLVRGAESMPSEQAAWGAMGGSAVAAEQPAWRRWIRFWWIPALAIFLAVGYLASARRDGDGAITAGGTLAIEDVRVGDCFNSDPADAISSVDARRCDEAHDYEMFHVATWSGAGSGYPSEDAMIAFVVDECVPAFEQWVGRSFQVSRLDFVHFVPLEEGWEAGDRVFQCAMFDPAAPGLSESLRDADR